MISLFVHKHSMFIITIFFLGGETLEELIIFVQPIWGSCIQSFDQSLSKRYCGLLGTPFLSLVNLSN